MTKSRFIKYTSVAVLLSAFFLTLMNSALAIEYMKKGLKLCSDAVIPSLFPFMVISDLIVSSGAGEAVAKTLTRPVKALFKVNDAMLCAFILGAVCGFPIGAVSLVSMYDRGVITKGQCATAMTFCNNPGSAFVLSVVGVSLFGSKSLGTMLYFSVLFSAVAAGIICSFIFKDKNTEFCTEIKTAPSSSKEDGIALFTSSIQRSCNSMLTVCSYVLFFSALIGCLGALTERLGVSKDISSLLFGFFELSSGVAEVSEVFSPEASLAICGMLLGWSGLSVHFQIMTVCRGRGISFKPYFFAKVLQGIISGLTVFGAVKLFPSLGSIPTAELSDEILAQAAYTNGAFVCVIFFIAALLPTILHLWKKRFCGKF